MPDLICPVTDVNKTISEPGVPVVLSKHIKTFLFMVICVP